MSGRSGPLVRRRLKRVINFDDARREARKVLPRILFDYVDGGATDEVTLRRNLTSFQGLSLRPRMATWVPRPDLRTKVLGVDLSMPVLIAPCGGMRLLHPDGDVALARAAAKAGIVQVVASAAGYTLEEIGQIDSPKWFQLYKFRSRPAMESLVFAAAEAKYDALVVTVDSAIAGHRERDFRSGFRHDLRINLRSAAHLGPKLVRRPGWLSRFIRDGMPFGMPNTARFTGAGLGTGLALPLTELSRDGAESSCPSWADIEWIRANWPGPLVIKGILSGDDARRAIDAGAEAVVVSNHGGRQLDGLPASISALPEVVDAVGDCGTVLLDSGVRRGTDVVKALALGAKAVMIGRLAAWGLAIGGEPGVTHVIELLRAEMVRTMCLMGCPSVGELELSWLA